MITGAMFRDGILSASNNISNNRAAVDALNIFPVPDGDTGTNMSMTIGAAAKDMAALPDDCTIEAAAKTAAASMLRGARGNSGVILSLIFRGISKSFKGLETADAKAVAKAFRAGTDAAYKAVMKPTEGTILTVVRKAADAAEAATEGGEEDPLEVCQAALVAAQEALEDTPNLLPVLKKSGVVDAGGQGLLLILQGMKSVFKNNSIVQAIDGDNQKAEQKPKTAVAAADEEIKFTYCSEFLIEKSKNCKKDPISLRAYLESIGDCVVVVEDGSIIKVHVHSNEPGNVLQHALKYGQLINIKIDNMRHQHDSAAEETGAEADEAQNDAPAAPENDYGFVCVCAGDGIGSLFEDLGADKIVSGGQTMNPSTDDIYHAVMQTPAKTVYVLPNNSNIVMAAQQTTALVKDRTVRIVPTKTVPQGISAMLAFDDNLSAEENVQEMTAAAAHVKTGSVTFAARDSDVDKQHIKEGQIMGLAEGKIKFLDDSDIVDVAKRTALSLFNSDENALITIIYGSETTEEQAQQLEDQLKEALGTDVEITTINGGQPIYYFILSVE